jgi:hypothetical protein
VRIKQRPTLRFLTDDLKHRQVAIDYWAGGLSDGKWQWCMTLTEISDKHKLKGTALTNMVRSAATAVEKDFRCAACNDERGIEDRSDFNRRVYEGDRCLVCKRSRNYARPSPFETQDQDFKTLQTRSEFLQRLVRRAAACDYAKLDYVEASILYAILRTSDREFTGDPFTIRFFDGLTPDLVRRMFKIGALQVSPQTTVNAIKFDRSGKIQADPYRVVWALAPDVHGLTHMHILKLLKAQSESRC